MDIDILSINNRRFCVTGILRPPILNTLRIWSENQGWGARIVAVPEKEAHKSVQAPVVAMSVYTPSAPASYRVAEKLRKQGKVVIMGGPHFRGGMSAEAMGRCDVVAESVSEQKWALLLDDIQAGRIAPGADGTHKLVDQEENFRYPADYRRNINDRSWYQLATIPTSLGCPYGCEFCDPLMKGKYLDRGVDVIIEDLAQMKGGVALFCDATFGLNKKYTMELMEAAAPLRKNILVETSIARVADKELVAAMARGGVKAMEVGIETLSGGLNKHGSQKSRQQMMDTIAMVHDHGILIQGNFILGLDCDGPECFDNAYEFYVKSRLDFIYANLLTPFPATRLYRRLKEEGRIIDDNWENYDFATVVHRPKNLSPDHLHDGYHNFCASAYGMGNIARKVARAGLDFGLGKQTAFMTLYHLYYHRVVDKMISTAPARKPLVATMDQRPQPADA
ncbi:MAG: radical SAM protein [Nitrospinota bacterium]|nr:radical SAM protein [Nitrospinota bacterium]